MIPKGGNPDLSPMFFLFFPPFFPFLFPSFSPVFLFLHPPVSFSFSLLFFPFPSFPSSPFPPSSDPRRSLPAPPAPIPCFGCSLSFPQWNSQAQDGEENPGEAEPFPLHGRDWEWCQSLSNNSQIAQPRSLRIWGGNCRRERDLQEEAPRLGIPCAGPSRDSHPHIPAFAAAGKEPAPEGNEKREWNRSGMRQTKTGSAQTPPASSGNSRNSSGLREPGHGGMSLGLWNGNDGIKYPN